MVSSADQSVGTGTPVPAKTARTAATTEAAAACKPVVETDADPLAANPKMVVATLEAAAAKAASVAAAAVAATVTTVLPIPVRLGVVKVT